MAGAFSDSGGFSSAIRRSNVASDGECSLTRVRVAWKTSPRSPVMRLIQASFQSTTPPQNPPSLPLRLPKNWSGGNSLQRGFYSPPHWRGKKARTGRGRTRDVNLGEGEGVFSVDRSRLIRRENRTEGINLKLARESELIRVKRIR